MVEKDKRAIKKDIENAALFFSKSSAPLSLQGVNIIPSSFLNAIFDTKNNHPSEISTALYFPSKLLLPQPHR